MEWKIPSTDESMDTEILSQNEFELLHNTVDTIDVTIGNKKTNLTKSNKNQQLQSKPILYVAPYA